MFKNFLFKADKIRKMNIPLFFLFSACVAIISISTGFLYDEASFFSQYYIYYIFGGHIFYFWPFGVYYYIMITSSFLINIPFASLGLDTAMVQEFTVKFPFLISMYLTAIGIYLILLYEHIEKGFAKKVLWISLLTPIIIYDAAFHGNGMIIALFFEVFSVVFLYSRKYYTSSIFLGIAAASYLFPIFLIIPMLYFIYKKTDIKKSFLYFCIFFLIFLLGQGIPVLVYLFYGVPLSQGSILGGIIGISSAGISMHSVSVISPWGPYFLIYEFSGYLITMRLAEIIFGLVMLISGFIFIIFKKNPSIKDVIGMFLIESLLFIIFGLNSAPQYLTAIAPFSIILFALNEDYRHLSFLTLLTFFDLGAFFTSSTGVISGFLIILNPQLNAYYLKSPPILSHALYSLYVLFLFVYLIYFVYSQNSAYINKIQRISKPHISEEELKRKSVKLFSYFVIFTLLLIVIVAPGIQNPPQVIPTVGNLVEENYMAEPISNNTSISSSMHQSYIIHMGDPWSFLDSYSRTNGNYILNIPPSPINTSTLGDFGQTSLIRSYPNATYSERFYFPFNSIFHGYFLIFGTNITPLIYLEGNNTYNSLNLTNFTSKVKTIDGDQNFFEIKDSKLINAGWYTLEIKIPENNAYISVTKIDNGGVTFNTYTSEQRVHVNAQDIPRLIVNSTEIQNTTLSLYISLSSVISVSFNGKIIGNYSPSTTGIIVIPSAIIKNNNNITISGYYINTQSIVLHFDPPLSFSYIALEESFINLLIGIMFLGIFVTFILYMIRFIKRNVRNI